MPSWKKMIAISACLIASACALYPQTSFAGALRDRLLERRAQHEQRQMLDDDVAAAGPGSLPANIRIVRDIPYGSDSRQRFDVYGPPQTHGALVILMVHGGGWACGDKAARSVIENKVAHWVPRGFIVVSINYRMLPDTAPIEQAGDVARALAAAQDMAAAWGGDRTKFVLMGHSAGAHLVALLTASPQIAAEFGATPWLGTVALDSAALDVARIMEGRHLRLYDRAFGSDAGYWRTASPFHALAKAGQPMLLVCSTRRDDSCSQAARFAAKAMQLGMQATVLKQDLSHKDINQRLDEEGRYTEAVESFLRGLDRSLAGTLDGRIDGTRATTASQH